MKLLLEYIRLLFDDDKYTALDKTILVSIYLCAFSIILSVAFAQLFAIVIIILSVVRFIKNPKRKRSPFDIPLLIFVFIRILSIFLSTDITASIHVLYTEIPYYALFYAITQENNILSERHIQSLLGIFIVTAIIGSCYGTVTVLLGLKERAESFTSGYYNFGSYLTASLTMVLILGRSTMFNRKRWVWYGLVLIMSVGLLLTLNRIHICIMILAFIIVGLVQERKLLLIMAVVIAVAILISPSIRQRLDQTIHFTEHLSDRDVIWKGASQIWSNHPYFGYGPHTFSKIFPFPNELQDKKINGWHNDYLQVYIESGVLCLLAMLWLIVNIYRQVFIYLRKYKNDRQKREIVISVMAGITTILLSSLTGSAFLDVLIRMMFGFLLAFLALLLRNKKPMNQMQ